jgi:hypothetical protein
MTGSYRAPPASDEGPAAPSGFFLLLPAFLLRAGQRRPQAPDHDARFGVIGCRPRHGRAGQGRAWLGEAWLPTRERPRREAVGGCWRI